jgi:hypothetical protein
MRRKAVVALGIATGIVEATIVTRRRGFLFGAWTVVRCRQGHLFTTIWVPGVSVKALRLGWWRLQRCPVGRHWSLVTPVEVATLSQDDREVAAQHRDAAIP